MDANALNPLALAYIGDAVYEVEIRKHLIDQGFGNVNTLHNRAVNFVKADAQASIIRTLMSELSEEEQRLVKRARNHKTATKAKNTDPVTYKWATAFEALAGYFYLTEQKERFDWLMAEAINIIEWS